MLDQLGTYYVLVFPIASAIIGWTLLSGSLRSGLSERWGLRNLQGWRYIAGYSLFVTAWLAVVAGCIVLFSLAIGRLDDPLLVVAAFSALAWIGSGVYWSILAWSAETVLNLPTPLARRTASNTLLWNLLLTLPYAFMAMPYTMRA